jgi:hypothetical protein
VVPLGITLALKLVPRDVIVACRKRANAASGRPASRFGAAFMIGLWVIAAAWAALFLKDLFDR